MVFYRRLIGRRFDDPVVKKDGESWPFKVIEQGGNPLVQVQYLGETKTFSPQEISSMVLMKVRNFLLVFIYIRLCISTHSALRLITNLVSK